jgi:hypothetical protein
MKIKTTLYSLFEALLDSIEEEFPEWETREQDEFAREVISDLAFTGKLKLANLRVENYPQLHPLLLQKLASSG